MPATAGWSGYDESRQADGLVIARRCDGFRGRSAATLEGQLVVLLVHNGATRRVKAPSQGKVPTTPVCRLIADPAWSRELGAVVAALIARPLNDRSERARGSSPSGSAAKSGMRFRTAGHKASHLAY
jgi:hypothetical protein